MDQYIVGISVDKVQRFLYEVFQVSSQEKQEDNQTLKTVIASSQIVAEHLYQKIGLGKTNGKFSGKIKDVLLQCSGVCIFLVSMPEKEIQKKLNELFCEYYQAFNGTIFLRSTYFKKILDNHSESDLYSACLKEKELDWKICAIQCAKSRLKSAENISEIIQQNQKVLFEFQDIQTNILNFNKKYFEKIEEYNGAWIAENIDELYVDQGKQEKNRFRVAIIKADLDGMGDLFNQTPDYLNYKKISDILNQTVCLSNFVKAAKTIYDAHNSFKVYPFYIAGDDLFFAVPTSELVWGIKLCKKILRKINNALKKIPQKNAPSLSLSVGIDLAFNTEPLRYYYHRVEKQLQIAKNKGRALNSDKNTKGIYQLMIAVNHFPLCIYHPNKNNKIIKEKNIQTFNRIIENARKLKKMISKGFPAHHFLYGLLDKLNDSCENTEQSVCLSNAVLYHLIPKYLNGADEQLRQYELFFLKDILRIIIVKKETKSQYELCFKKECVEKLINYVKLLLLFTDDRFDIVVEEENMYEEDLRGNKQKIKELRGNIFNRSLRYLYEQNLDEQLAKKEGESERINLRNCFVDKRSYIPDSSDQPVEVYCTLKLSSSILYRLKKSMDTKFEYEKLIDQQKNMIERTLVMSLDQKIDEGSSNADARRSNEVLEVEKNKVPKLTFIPDQFKKWATNKLWTHSYIDSLLVLYKFNQALIRYRVLYSNENKNKK